MLSPLRERTEDVIDLAHFLLGTARPGDWIFTPEVSALLTEYPWPGNARELRSVLERAIIFARERTLAPEHFPGLILPEDSLLPVTPQAESLNLAEMERILVRAALERHHGDVAKAAKALGISRATLYRRMQKSGLET